MPKKGRPSKFKPEMVEQAYKLGFLGATDKQIADFYNIAESTLSEWKLRHPEFPEALKRGKQESDARVVKSLYQRALGYKHKALHFSNYKGCVTETEYVEHHPPDTTAAIFWLCNRNPEVWRQKQNLELEAGSGVNLTVNVNINKKEKP